jgi:hypothetical protein
VYFATDQLQELEQIINYAQLDTSAVTSAEITEAIMKSFLTGEHHTIPTGTCILSEKSRSRLMSELGLRVGGAFSLAAQSQSEIKVILDHLVAAVKHKPTIREECMSLLHKLICLEKSIGIDTTDDDTIFTLVDFMQGEDSVYVRELSIQMLFSVLCTVAASSSFDDWSPLVCDLVLEPIAPSERADKMENQEPTVLKSLFDQKYIRPLIESLSYDKTVSQVMYILAVLLTTVKQNQIVDEVVSAGAIPHLVRCILGTSIDREFAINNALTTLFCIARTSDKYREEALNLGLLIHICERLKTKFSESRDECLFLLSLAASEEAKISTLVSEDSPLIPFLIEMMTAGEGQRRKRNEALTLDTLALILSQKNNASVVSSVLVALEQSGVIPNLVSIFNRNVSGNDSSTFQNALLTLKKMVEFYSLNKHKASTKEILMHVKHGVQSTSSNVRLKWVTLVHALVTRRTTSSSIVIDLLESGIVKELAIAMNDKNDVHVKSKGLAVVTFTKTQCISHEKHHICLLQKKKAWLAVEDSRCEMMQIEKERDSLNAKLVKMRKKAFWARKDAE